MMNKMSLKAVVVTHQVIRMTLRSNYGKFWSKKIIERTRSRAKPQLKRKLSKCQNIRNEWSEKGKVKPKKDQRNSAEDQRRHLVDEKEPSKDIKSPKRLFPEDLRYKIIHKRNKNK